MRGIKQIRRKIMTVQLVITMMLTMVPGSVSDTYAKAAVAPLQ